MQGGGIKTVSCQLAPRLMLPKEVKNGHIAKGKNPVKDKKCDSGFFKCGKKKFFHWLRLLCQDKVGAEDYIIFAHKRIYKFHGKDKVAGEYIRHTGVADIIIRASGKNSAVAVAVKAGTEANFGT